MKLHIISNYQVIVLLLLVMILLSGCAINFRAGHVPDKLPWPPEETINRKSISVNTVINQELSGKMRENQLFESVIQTNTIAIFNDSRLFYNVIDDKQNPQPTDLKVYVIYSDKRRIPWYYHFTGIFLERSVTIELDVRDYQGNRLGIVKKSEKETEVTSILFILITPFIERRSLLDLEDDVLRAAIMEAHEKSLF